MFGSPYKGILKGAKAAVSVGILDGEDLVQAVSVASALNAEVGTLSTIYGMNVPMTYFYYLTPPHLEDPFALIEVWVESGNNAMFEIIGDTTLRFSGTPGAGTYTCYVRSEDQDSWVHEQVITVTVT